MAWANDFGTRRYPFIPALVVNQNPPLCDAYLAALREEFLSTKVNMIVTKIQGATWLDWKPVKPESGNEPHDLWRLDLDLDGSGKTRTVVLHKSVHTFGSGDVENRDAYIFDSPTAAEKWLERAVQSENPFTGIRQYYPGEGVTSKTPPYEVYFGGEHKWFTFQGKYYFLTSEEMNADFAGVAQLFLDGSRKLVCVARTNPPHEIYDSFMSKSGLKSYLKVLWTIGHASGGPCGSLGSEYRHDARASAAVRRAAVRHWATSDISAGYNTVYYNYDSRMLKYVEDWGYQDAWNYREYQTYLNHVQSAIQALEEYYRDAFHVPNNEARLRAQAIFEQLTGAHFLIPGDYQPGANGYIFMNSKQADLHKGILQGYSRAELLPLLEDKTTKARRILVLAKAVEQPALLQEFIDSGEDVNSQSSWGKTPLMVAAHMNRPDSVKILLRAGADPNLQTNAMNECGVTIERGDRTALMYAAENADIDVMHLLLEAGAKIDAKDSRGNGIDYYLSLNPYLSEVQKKMPIQNLLMSVRKDSVSKPSFDCAMARQWVDKLVCKDPLLSRLDREMATAFTTWKSKTPSMDREKLDQRAWLVKRAEQCRPFEEEHLSISCLQLETRARIRYLHNRIAE
jgi:uncharacterized protein YecT (DUF1311 family)